MNQVTVNDGMLVAELMIINPEVVDYVSRFSAEKQADTVIRAIEVGVSILERFQSTQNIDFMRQQTDAIVMEFNGAVQTIPVRLEAELIRKLGTEEGQALAPIASLISQTDKLLRDKVREVHALLNEHIDPRRSDTTLGRVLERLRTLLDPKHDDSVQKSVDKSLQSVAGEQGVIALIVKKVVEESIKPLKENLDSLAKEVRGQEAVSEALENTTVKGRSFEDDLLSPIRAWATMVGAQVEHVGPDNQPGDFVLELSSSRLATTDLKIVIEAKDDQTAKGRKRILDGMGTAMSVRSAHYGIFVAKTTDGFAKEIGEWAELQCQEGPVIACTAEHLRTALRFAVVDNCVRQLKSASLEADSASIETEIAKIRTSLARIRTINSKANAIKADADQIAGETNELKREVGECLTGIEDALQVVGGSASDVKEKNICAVKPDLSPVLVN